MKLVSFVGLVSNQLRNVLHQRNCKVGKVKRKKAKSTNLRGVSKALESRRSIGKAEVPAQTVKLKPMKASEKSTGINKDLKTTKSRGNVKSCGKSIRSLNINANDP